MVDQAPTAVEGWPSNRMLFVGGPHGSGKTSIVRHALDPTYSVFDLGPLVRQIHARETLGKMSVQSWVQMREAAGGHLAVTELLSEAILPDISDKPPASGAVVIGNRSWTGIEYFIKKFKPVSPKVVYFDAPIPQLLERYKTREAKPSLNEEDFHHILAEDTAMGLDEIRANADIVIDNVGSISDAVSKLRSFVGQWTPS